MCENMMTQDMRSAPSAAYNYPRCAVYLANNIAIYRFFFLPLASGFTVWTYAGQFIFIPSAATRLRKHQAAVCNVRKAAYQIVQTQRKI